MVSKFDVDLSGYGLLTFGLMNINEALSGVNIVTFGFVDTIETTWYNSEPNVTTTWGYL